MILLNSKYCKWQSVCYIGGTLVIITLMLVHLLICQWICHNIVEIGGWDILITAAKNNNTNQYNIGQ